MTVNHYYWRDSITWVLSHSYSTKSHYEVTYSDSHGKNKNIFLKKPVLMFLQSNGLVNDHLGLL